MCGAAVFRGAPQSAPTREYLKLGRKLGRGRRTHRGSARSGVAEPDLGQSIALLTEAAPRRTDPGTAIGTSLRSLWLGSSNPADHPLAAVLEAIPALIDYRTVGARGYLILVPRSIDSEPLGRPGPVSRTSPS